MSSYSGHRRGSGRGRAARGAATAALIGLLAACTAAPLRLPSPALPPTTGFTSFSQTWSGDDDSLLPPELPAFLQVLDGRPIDNASIYGCSIHGGPIWLDVDWVGGVPSRPPAFPNELPMWGAQVFEGYHDPLLGYPDISQYLGSAGEYWYHGVFDPPGANLRAPSWQGGGDVVLDPGQCFTVRVTSWYTHEFVTWNRCGECSLTYYTIPAVHHLEYTLNWV